MSVPLWVVATMLYVIALVITPSSNDTGSMFDAIGIAFQWMGYTILYLLFWIVYLALQ